MKLNVLPIILTVLAVVASPALAHTGEYEGGLASGFFHPITGWDHVVAMVAVGLWGGILGRPAIWALPITFPVVMSVGAALGVAGIPIPFIEVGIALSGVVLGLLILFMVSLPLPAAVVIVALFAIFHGWAHGAELPDAANPFAFALGFVVATGLLHLFGILLGTLMGSKPGQMIVRACGAAIALVGAAFLFGVA